MLNTIDYEIDRHQAAMGLPSVTVAVFLMGGSLWENEMSL
jgi:hypothetical protein